jgi:hypothetical protein
MDIPGVLMIDGLAAVLFMIGIPLAVRPGGLSAWLTRKRAQAAPDLAGVASVLRMVGVMLAAFGLVIAAFANLIAYYGQHPPTP